MFKLLAVRLGAVVLGYAKEAMDLEVCHFIIIIIITTILKIYFYHAHHKHSNGIFSL